MPRVKDSEFVSFNDGNLSICEVENRSIVREKYRRLRFGKRTVGVTRFWNAKVASSEIDLVAAILPVPGVTTMDICLIGEQQYKIEQVQDKFDAYPPCLYLSLARSPIRYRDERDGTC